MAGDIAAVAKLSSTTTGDTLAPKGTPVVVPAPPQPEPVLGVAVVARTQTDDDKLANALHRLVEEDPALVVERDDETHQTILRGMGETHLQITLEKLERKFGVAVDQEEVRVPYRETITATAEAEGKYKKQSGGHGQFGVTTLRIEPLERGAGFEFVDKIVGGAIPRQFIPAVEKGIDEAMADGGVFGYPVVDVRVYCIDGKYHPVDSSEMSFKMAGRLGFREALAQAEPGHPRAHLVARGHRAHRSAGRRDGRSELAPGAGAGNRGRRRRRADHRRPGADRRAEALRHRSALTHERTRALHHPPRPLRRAPLAPGRFGRHRQHGRGRRVGVSLDLSRLAPDDAVVALRSFPRRYRDELVPIPDDDRIEEFATRLGPDGESALDLVNDVVRTWVLLGQELRRVLTTDQPTLHPAVTDPSRRHWDTPGPDSTEDALALLERQSDDLVEMVTSVSLADDWARTAPIAGGGSLTALDLLREVVRVGAEGLARVHTVLEAVRHQ